MSAAEAHRREGTDVRSQRSEASLREDEKVRRLEAKKIRGLEVEKVREQDDCPDEIRYARHGHEFHGVKMNRMIPAGLDGSGKTEVGGQKTVSSPKIG